MSLAETATYWRYGCPRSLLGEILTKRWIDNAIPVFVLIVVVAGFGIVIPDFFSAGQPDDLTRQLGRVRPDRGRA